MTEGDASALDRLPCGWLRIDTRGKVLAVNAKFCHMLGVEAESLQGKSFDSLLTRPSRVLYQSYIQPLLHLHGNIEEFPLTFDLPGGQPLDALIYSAAHSPPDTPQSEALIDVMVASVRTRRNIEDEMLRIKRAADHAPSMIFQLMQLTDGTCHFPYTSEAIRRMYGVTPQQAGESAERLLGLLNVETRQTLSSGLREAAQAGRDWQAVFEVARGQGGVRWHEVHATPRRLANGVTLWHGHCADVTDKRTLEANVVERQALVQMHQARSEFLARLSHEIRTPLNGILGFAELLAADKAENLSAEQRARLGLLESSGRHLLELVNQVLQVTSLEAGQVRVELQELELRPVLVRAMQEAQSLARDADVTLLPLSCPDGLWVQSNELRLRQVVANLLSNAIKYNRPAGTAHLAATSDERGVQLAVVDTGLGMSSEQKAALFQPLNRLGAEKTAVEGHGLGLVITKHLLSLMGGRLTVSSELNRGSTFSVSLAAGKSQATTQRKPPQVAARPPLPTRDQLAPAVQSGGRVLYVEDNEINVVLMSAVLGMRPQTTFQVAITGAGALEVAREKPFDLLLIDKHLPDVDGIELLSRLREIDGFQSTPAIMVSAAVLQQDIDRALAKGFMGYWTKPLDIDRALAQLDDVLGHGLPGRATKAN